MEHHMQNKLPAFHLFLIAAIVVIFLPSCRTYDFFTMDVLEPATVDIPVNIKKMLVTHNLNLSNRDTLGTFYQIYEQQVYDTLYIDTLLGRYAIVQLADKLNNVGRFEAIFINSAGRNFPVDHALFTNEDVAHLKTLCLENQADAVIVLNSAQKYVTYNAFYNDFEGYYGEFSVFLETNWLLINPFTTRLMDKNSRVDTIFFQSTDFLFEYGFKSEERRHDYMMAAFDEAAKRYYERISPHYATTDRVIFTKGNRFLKKGYEEATQGNWDKAASIWDKSLEGNDPRNLSKACFNLALASEMNGLLTEALEWAKESHRLFPDTINQVYISILKERLEQQEKILKQMESDY